MREIKFRGKRIDNGEWIYGYYVKDPKGKHRIYWQPFEEATSNTYHFVIPETVSQFTGFKDIKGVEIYEGDLLAIGTIDFGFMQNNYVVIFEGCDYILRRKDLPFNWGRLSRLSDMNWECEIIGNIHS